MSHNDRVFKIIHRILRLMVFRLIILLSWTHPALALICYPQVNPHLPQYIIGYGSLMDEQSKRRTDPTAQESFPVLIKGYKRSWSVYGNLPGLNATFLYVFEDKGSSFNGVIYKLKHSDHIQQYDKRETIYCRKELNDSQLKIVTTALPAQKQVWIYSQTIKMNQRPSQDHPIVQSYVDSFIRGCIQNEEKFKIKNFAKECILTTDDWPEQHWVNDRIYPRRPSAYEPYARKIDDLLKELLPKQFNNIKIE